MLTLETNRSTRAFCSNPFQLGAPAQVLEADDFGRHRGFPRMRDNVNFPTDVNEKE
jgi:hypothetical protein